VALTKKRRLRAGASVWTSYPRPAVVSRPIQRSFKTDVLVVGAGISGALVAYTLAATGRKIAIVDRRAPVTGSTLASTALLQFEIDLPLTKLQRKIGVKPANRAWLRSKQALDALHALIGREKIHASPRLRPSVYLAGDVLNARDLLREAKARQTIGLPSEWLSRTELKRRFGLSRAAAIATADNLTVDPRALASGVLRRAAREGARLLSPCNVIDIQCGKRSVLAQTEQGFEIEARHIVLCCGYELPKIVPAEGHRLASTWAIATRAQAQRLWPQQCLIWEASQPYLYVRSTTDGRVICGGEDEDFVDVERRDALIAKKSAKLELKLGRLLPNIDPRAVFRWTGTFGQTPNGLPSVGTIPKYPRCYAVLGYGGNGITFSMLAAQLISDALRKRKDPDSRIFAFK
jgi:glycine/D-amino acid oxidase-like deaminating enzyme